NGSPMASIVVAAGEHEVVARQGAAAESQHVAARGGELVELHFQRVPDAPGPTGAIGWTATPERTESRTPRAKWITTIALGSGALVAAGVGVGFGIVSLNESKDAANVHNEIAPGSAWTGTKCFGTNAGSALCRQLASDVDANRLNWSISAASYVCAGALAAASVATWMLWKPKGLVAGPTIGARGAGFALGGPRGHRRRGWAAGRRLVGSRGFSLRSEGRRGRGWGHSFVRGRAPSGRVGAAPMRPGAP